MTMATGSLSEYIRLIKAHLPIALIDTAQWDSILGISDILPSAMTTFFGFECRLGNAEAKADFLLCADASEAGRRVLAANAYNIDLPKTLFHHPVWQHIRLFSTNWESEASVLYDRIRNVWLEFDTATPTDSMIPVPSCFVAPEPIFVTPALQQDHPHAAIWDIALPLLLGHELAQATKQNLIQCIAQLPEHAYIFQIGLMLARESDTVRLCIRDIPPQALVTYLQGLNWPGNLDRLNALLTEITPMVDRIDLDIDVSDILHPKIGLECYLFKQPKFDDRWNNFLDYLVLQGHCLLQKRQALIEYPGYIRQKLAPDLWPSDMRKLGGLLGTGYEWVVFKGLHHIKLVYQADELKEAKAYLYSSRSLISSIVKEPQQEQ
jgi:hypothetical protein